MSSVNGHVTGAVEMSADQVDKMILMTEQEIAQQAKDLQPLAVQRNDAKAKMEAAEDAYATSRRVHDELARKMEENKVLLDHLTSIKSGKKGAAFRLMRGGSHVAEGGPRKKREVSWTQTAIDVLRKDSQFLKLDILVEKCATIHANKFDAARLKTAKYSMMENFKKDCERNKEYPDRRTFSDDRLMEWNDKIGLQSWFGPDGRPKIQFIKAFVYSDNGKQSVPA